MDKKSGFLTVFGAVAHVRAYMRQLVLYGRKGCQATDNTKGRAI